MCVGVIDLVDARWLDPTICILTYISCEGDSAAAVHVCILSVFQ